MKLPSILIAAALTTLAASCSTQQAEGVASAATTPLSDLNLINAPIPDALAAAKAAPYARPTRAGCDALFADIRALDEVLGTDLDAPPTDANPGLVERAGTFVTTQATSAVRRTAEGAVPFRPWVRKLTGAERYANQVAAAIAAGTVRRAFLKGMVVAQNCA
jgi:hypothetical protein